MMKKTLLAALLATVSSTICAQNITSIYFIGDSLTDTGQLGSRFTTNPGNVWSHYFAEKNGLRADPSGQGGTNLAVGGARVSVNELADPTLPIGPSNPVLPAMTSQLEQLLAVKKGQLESDAIYSVWGGANDLFAVVQDPLQAPMILMDSVVNQVGIIDSLHKHGARYILVGDIPDLGKTPEFAGIPVVSDIATLLSSTYNQGLALGLASSQANIIPLTISGLLTEVMADPTTYGFSNVTDAACSTSSLYCGPAQLVSADADQTHLYADGVHPSSKAHQAIAQYADAVFSAGTVVGMLGATANQAGLSQMQRIDRRLSLTQANTEQGVQVWAEGAALFSNGSHERSQVHGTNGSGSLGISKQVNQWTMGTYLHYDRIDSTLSSSSLQQKRFAGGLYGRWADANTWVNAQLYYADLDTRLDRHVDIGAAHRDHHSKAKGHQAGGRISAGYNWQHGSVTHGPLLGLNLQKAKIKALAEQATSSSSMRFAAQTQNSLQSSLGYQLSVAVNPDWSVYASAQWLHEFKKANKEVGAGMQTGLYSDRAFYLPTQTKLAKNTGVFELGASGRLTKQWDVNAGISMQTANAPNAQNSVYLGTAYRF